MLPHRALRAGAKPFRGSRPLKLVRAPRRPAGADDVRDMPKAHQIPVPSRRAISVGRMIVVLGGVKASERLAEALMDDLVEADNAARQIKACSPC